MYIDVNLEGVYDTGRSVRLISNMLLEFTLQYDTSSYSDCNKIGIHVSRCSQVTLWPPSPSPVTIPTALRSERGTRFSSTTEYSRWSPISRAALRLLEDLVIPRPLGSSE